jgi:ATP-binding protein involved in chromosome partitioning
MTANGRSDIRAIVAIHSAKGGVGKSTVTVNLALAMAATGMRVGILDADIHGPSIAKMMGNEQWPEAGRMENTVVPLEQYGVTFISMGNLTANETPLIWRGAMLTSALTQLLNDVEWGELDVLLIDMPPGTGDAQLTICQSVALTGAVVVTTPQELSLADSVRGARIFQKLNVPIFGVVENMGVFHCPTCKKSSQIFGDSAVDLFAQELDAPVLARLPLHTSATPAGDDGKPLVLHDPSNPLSQAFDRAASLLHKALQDTTGALILDLFWELMPQGATLPHPPQIREKTGIPLQAMWQIDNSTLGFLWENGATQKISVQALRRACPCASCVDEWTGEPLLDVEKIPTNLSLERVQTVGRYGIQPLFTDGHATGIYRFDLIKSIAHGFTPGNEATP